MQIKIMSDLHLEFYKDNEEFKIPEQVNDKDTILILAGDVAVAASMKRFRYFFDDVNSRFKKIIYICGNHEFYQSSIITAPQKIRDGLKGLSNIHFLENQKVEIDGVVFICATLWTDFGNNDPLVIFDAKHRMNDFRIIRNGPPDMPWMRKFHPNEAYDIHIETKKFIFDEIAVAKKHKKKVVVVSHHGPSTMSVMEKFKNDSLNGAYISNLEEEILNTRPDIWIHGHTHASFDYKIGDTRVICNPFGYKNVEENLDFDDMLIEV